MISIFSIQLVVVAQDFGEPALRHTTNVFISVDDVNDVVPKFEQDEQRYAKIFRKTQRCGGGGLQYWEVTEKGWVGFSKRGMKKQLDTFTKGYLFKSCVQPWSLLEL
jgi:hypothetical protein